MAKPDLEDGYLRYAHQLDAALACADFTKGARIVLREVFSQVFGPARMKAAKVFPSELARTCGFDKAHLCRALRELTESGVLERAGDCEYRFIKDYERWTRKGAPRLSKSEVAYATTAPDRVMSHKYRTGANPGNNHESDHQTCGANPGTGSVPIQAPGGANPGTGSVPESAPNGANPGTDHVVPPRPPIGERTRGIETGEEEGEEFAPAPARVAPLPPEYKAVGLYAEEQGGDVSWAIWSDRMGRAGHPAALIRRAIDEAAGAGKLSQAYVAKILQRWAVEGPPNGRAAPAPAPPVERKYVTAGPEHVHPKFRRHA